MLTTEDALTTARRLHKTLLERRPEVDELNRYFRGEQPLKFASEEWTKFHTRRYSGFCDNWCGVVGSAPGERTELTGFRLGDDVDVQSGEEKDLWADWERNDGPAQSSQGFLAATVSKRSYAMVWGSKDDEPVLTWESPDQVVVEYAAENPRVRTYALKSWQDDRHEYMTLYEPDAVWKWKRPATSKSGLHLPANAVGTDWEIRQPASDDTWPVRNPLGLVPIVEFPNRPTLGGEPMSDISGTRAMQDAINLLWAYLFGAADYASMPGRVITGAEYPKVPVLDDNGNKIAEKPVDITSLAKGRMLFLTGQAKISQWDAAKLDVFTSVINVAIRHIAAQTRTPIYLVHGELGNVNGETLAGLDAPLVSKVKEAHKFYRRPVREVFALMALVRNQQEVAKQCAVGSSQWANPELRTDAQVSDAALKDIQVGLPLQAVLEDRYGYGQTEIARIMKMREDDLDPFLKEMQQKG